MLIVNRHISIPETELVERFLRADGPGGQHVNRTESAVELRFDVRASASLPEEVRERMLARRDRRLTSEGVLVIRDAAFATRAGRGRPRTTDRTHQCRDRGTDQRVATSRRASKERRLAGKREDRSSRRTKRDWSND